MGIVPAELSAVLTIPKWIVKIGVHLRLSGFLLLVLQLRRPMAEKVTGFVSPGFQRQAIIDMPERLSVAVDLITGMRIVVGVLSIRARFSGREDFQVPT